MPFGMRVAQQGHRPAETDHREQAVEGQVLQQEGLKGLRTADSDGMTHTVAARLIVEGAKLERLARA